MIMIVNNTFQAYHDLMLKVFTIDMKGKESPENNLLVNISPTSVQPYFTVIDQMKQLREHHGGFLQLQLINEQQNILSENLYWIPDSTGNFSGLQTMQQADIKATARKITDKTIEVKMNNALGNPLAFFIRVSLVNSKTGERILPVFYDNNYISVLPGSERVVHISFDQNIKGCEVSLSGWNVKDQKMPVKSL